jgi:phenylpyruvate tautomerase
MPALRGVLGWPAEEVPMPLIRIDTNRQLMAEERGQLGETLSRIAAEVIGKPEAYVQTIVPTHAATMRHGGADGPAAFVEVRSIGGLGPAVNRRLAERICAALAGLGIPRDRVYLNFLDVAAADWGHDGTTFG